MRSILKNMLQRIQTLYLIIGFLVSICTIAFLPVWRNAEGVDVNFIELLMLDGLMLKSIPIIGIVCSILYMVSIFLFKNRNQQIIINRLNMICNLYLLGIFVMYVLNLPGESEISEKGIGLFMPVVNIVLLFLANKAIAKDEALVKSVDRLR